MATSTCPAATCKVITQKSWHADKIVLQAIDKLCKKCLEFIMWSKLPSRKHTIWHIMFKSPLKGIFTS
jgi:hypothetical protein